jgi:4-hydroxy-3-polyprenylbenzoate decarboxylase
MSHRLALLVTGASGMALPRHVLAAMARHPEVEEVHLVVSKGAVQVLKHEMDLTGSAAEALVGTADLANDAARKVVHHRENALDAAISSGSFTLTGTAIIPCSAGTLGALATGAAGTLIHRAGAVALKERWPLVLGFRETPLTVIHLENLRRLAYLGATILPPVPAFYIGGEDFARFLDHYVLRVFDGLGIAAPGEPGLRWPG